MEPYFFENQEKVPFNDSEEILFQQTPPNLTNFKIKLLFGRYLERKRKITPEQIREAIDFQKEINLPLLGLAIYDNFITPAQALEIYKFQKKTGQLFKQVANTLGILTAEQIEKLSLIQKGKRVLIGEALVVKGFLTLEELKIELEEYQKEFGDA